MSKANLLGMYKTANHAGHVRLQLVGGYLVAICMSSLLSGCGSAAYEERLDATRRYFEFLDRVETNLAPSWTGPGIEQFRVPLQFRLIAHKKSDDDDDAKQAKGKESEEPDNRQPDYLDITLPELAGAWQAEVETGNSKSPGYLYMMTNYEMWRDKEGSRVALDFHGEVVDTLAKALKVPRPKESDWNEKRLPVAEGYVEKKAFISVTLTPEFKINETTTDFTLYLYQLNDIQIALLSVIPKDAEHVERLPERMTLSLETLKVRGTTPARRGSSGGRSRGRQKPGSSKF